MGNGNKLLHKFLAVDFWHRLWHFSLPSVRAGVAPSLVIPILQQPAAKKLTIFNIEKMFDIWEPFPHYIIRVCP